MSKRKGLGRGLDALLSTTQAIEPVATDTPETATPAPAADSTGMRSVPLFKFSSGALSTLFSKIFFYIHLLIDDVIYKYCIYGSLLIGVFSNVMARIICVKSCCLILEQNIGFSYYRSHPNVNKHGGHCKKLNIEKYMNLKK